MLRLHGFITTVQASLVLVHPDKVPSRTGWNQIENAATLQDVLAEVNQRYSVGLLAFDDIVIVESDIDFPSKVAQLGNVSDTVKVMRDNKPHGGALIYRLVDGPHAHRHTPQRVQSIPT